MHNERAMQVLEETCENLINSLDMANQELRRNNGLVDSNHSPLMRDLTHSLKNVLTSKAMMGMGRYRDEGQTGGGGGYTRMYRDDGKEMLTQKLDEAMNEAHDQQTRQILEDAKRRLKNL